MSLEIVVITGMSGSGKSLALRALEDSGYYCVDNLPPELLASFVALEHAHHGQRVAVAMDVRSATSLPLVPQQLKRLRAEAPGIVLVVRRVNYILMPPLLASGEISVGVSYTSDLPANAKRKVLRRSKPKLLRADTVPGPLSLDDFCTRPHALVSFAGDLSGFMDTELEKMGRKRHVVLAVPQFNGLSTLLAGTDIIATVPDYTAEALTAAGGVRAEDPPLDTPAFELHMAWRGAQDNDPGERWLRSRIQMFFGDPESL